MEDVHTYLSKKNFKKIKFKVLKSQHLLLKMKINGVSGSFILDTGASNSCVGFEGIPRFNLDAQASATKAAGAGATGIATQVAKINTLQIGRWKNESFPLIIIDLTHVNEALQQFKTKAIDGIIGADVLIKGNAIIDYSAQYLYLK